MNVIQVSMCNRINVYDHSTLILNEILYFPTQILRYCSMILNDAERHIVEPHKAIVTMGFKRERKGWVKVIALALFCFTLYPYLFIPPQYPDRRCPSAPQVN